jgi:hypothetical protein
MSKARRHVNTTAIVRRQHELHAQHLLAPTSPRTIVPGSITAMPMKQHDPETARLIAEWDAKQKGQL